MDNNCIDCKVRATVGMYSRCKVCYLITKMDRLNEQLSRARSMYWKAMVNSLLPSGFTLPDPPRRPVKNFIKKVTVKTVPTTYETTLERAKSGKIDSVKEGGTEVDLSKRAEKEKVLLKELGRDMGFKEGVDYTNSKYFKSLRYGKMVTLKYP